MMCDEDYFDATQLENVSFLPHPSEVHNPPPELAEDSIVVFVRILAVGNSKDEEDAVFSVYYLEVKCFSQDIVWFVYRRYSQFRQLSDTLSSEGYYVPELPPKQHENEFKIENIRKRKYDLEGWLRSLHDQRGLLNSAKDVQKCSAFRQFLLGNANCPPSPLSRIWPENMALRTSTEYMTSRNDLAKPFLKVSINDFEKIRIIGKGSFGKVTLVRKFSDQKLYAMKVLDKINIIRRKQVEHTITERRVLGILNHPFIVKLYYAFQTEDKLHFVLDYCAGGELFFHLSRLKKFPEPMARFYAAEITLALEALHDHDIVYRDLKPENILLDGEGHVKLADFGLAKENVSDPTTGAHSLCGTPEYLSPEVLSREGHGNAVDWWNLGMVTYEMLTGLPPWYTTDREKLFDRLRNAPLKFPFHVSRTAASLISKLLNRNPKERLGTRGSWQVTQHPFFSNIDWDALYDRMIIPPLDPCRNQDEIDTANFEREFTNMALTSTDEGNATHPVEESDSSEAFLNFTYDEQSAFEGLRNERRR